jgi:hypothetical protein
MLSFLWTGWRILFWRFSWIRFYFFISWLRSTLWFLLLFFIVTLTATLISRWLFRINLCIFSHKILHCLFHGFACWFEQFLFLLCRTDHFLFFSCLLLIRKVNLLLFNSLILRISSLLYHLFLILGINFSLVNTFSFTAFLSLIVVIINTKIINFLFRSYFSIWRWRRSLFVRWASIFILWLICIYRCCRRF